MGFFDRFTSKKSDSIAPGKASKDGVARWEARATDKRAQNYDRQEAIVALSEMRTGEAAAVLLKRFTFAIDPSITDQEEKDIALDGVVAAGQDAIEPVRKFVKTAESVAYPIRIIKTLLPKDGVVEELIVWLSSWDTEYSKFIDAKLQLLGALEDYKHPSIRAAVTPFLDDVNEQARFNAVAALFAQEDPESLGAFIKALGAEESFRIKNKIASGLVAAGWPIPEEQRTEVARALPPGFSLGADGQVRK